LLEGDHPEGKERPVVLQVRHLPLRQRPHVPGQLQEHPPLPEGLDRPVQRQEPDPLIRPSVVESSERSSEVCPWTARRCPRYGRAFMTSLVHRRPRALRVVLLAGVATLASSAEAAPALRERLSLNEGWRFQLGDLQGQGAIDDSAWRALALPHDWGIEGPFSQEHPGGTGKLFWWGVAWYRRRIALAAPPGGRRFLLEVDGAMSHAQVWLNGQRVGGWPYGYATFRLDLTPFLRAGENLLAIRLDNPPSSSRWYPGGGIFRNVWLLQTDSLAVPPDGTFVTTPQVTALAATVQAAVTLENHGATAARAALRTALHPLEEGGASGPAVATSAPVAVEVAAGGTSTTRFELIVPRPRLWSPASPALYVAVTTVEREGRLIDRHETVFGIRTVRFDPDKGLLLNGARVPIKGVCL